jgi:hypothetical protein
VCLKRAGAGEYLKTWGRRNFLLDLLIDRLRRLPTFIITLQAESSIIHPRSYLTADYNGDNGSRMATTPDAPSSQRFHIFFFSSYSFFFPRLFCSLRFTTREFVFAHMILIQIYISIYLSLFLIYPLLLHRAGQIAERGARVLVPE